MSSDRPWLEQLREGSMALQGVLGALLEAERQFQPPASPLERLQQITSSPEWAWLLTGGGGAGEQAFLDHYRALLQTDPAVAIAHAAALRALQALPPEPTNQSEKLHARHQWNERRRFQRMGQQGRGAS
jgi:hypothetical protein